MKPGDEIANHIMRNADDSYDLDLYAEFVGEVDGTPRVDLKFYSGTALLGLSMLPTKELRRLADFLVHVADEVDTS